MGSHLAQILWLPLFISVNAAYYLQGFITAYPYDTDTGIAHSRRYRCNGICFHSFSLISFPYYTKKAVAYATAFLILF